MPTNDPRAVTLTAEEFAAIQVNATTVAHYGEGFASCGINALRILAAAEARAREKAQAEQDAAIMAERRRDGVLWHGFYRVSADSGTWIQRSRIVASDKPVMWPHGWCVRFENYRTDKADGYWEEAEPDDWIDILGAMFKDLAKAPPAAPGPTDAEHPTLDSLAAEIREWQDATFPTATAASAAKHLLSEAHELVAQPTDPEEMADIFLLVIAVANKAGVNLAEAAAAKLAKNKARKWGKPNADGYVEHVKDDDAARAALRSAKEAGR